MEQHRKRGDQPNRSSTMEQAEGSRESMRETERMRNRGSGKDLGSSSDRAMFDDRESSEERDDMSGSSGSGASSERSRSDAGGITNRELSREQSEQQQLPDRGHSKSER